MAVATTLCLHPTIGDPQRFRIVPAKSLRINVLSPWISGLLEGSHRGIISHRGGAGELTDICLQSAEVKYIHTSRIAITATSPPPWQRWRMGKWDQGNGSKQVDHLPGNQLVTINGVYGGKR